jgi:hypothetical protein
VRGTDLVRPSRRTVTGERDRPRPQREARLATRLAGIDALTDAAAVA